VGSGRFRGGLENPFERSETGLKADVARSDEIIIPDFEPFATPPLIQNP
jgi:hypothetical protein